MQVLTIPKDKGSKKMLGDILMRNNPYASHRIDTLTITAYSTYEILEDI